MTPLNTRPVQERIWAWQASSHICTGVYVHAQDQTYISKSGPSPEGAAGWGHLHHSFGKQLPHEQQSCMLPTHCQYKSFREHSSSWRCAHHPIPGQGWSLHSLRHSRDAHQLCPYRKMWFQQPAKLQKISLLPMTHTLVVAWPSHHPLDSHQATSSTSIIQLHKEQQQKHPCTQQPNPPPLPPRQEELKMGGHGEGRNSWSLAGKRVKTCCDNLGKQDVARSQMPTLFPHPDEMLSRLPTPLRFVFIFNKCKKIPKATLYWQI